MEPARIKTAEKADLLHYTYTLKTGATWKGKIEKAVIRVKLNGIASNRIVKATPTGYQRNGGKELVWTLKNFKPTHDIELSFKRSGALASKKKG